MPDQLTPEIKIPVQEQDLHGITAEVKRHQENPEKRGLSGQELIKQSIRSYTNTSGQPADSTHNDAKDSDDSVLPDYAKDAPPETKLEIEHLLGMAFKEGVLKATQEAEKSNPYILDVFHDALAGKLYDELKKRGIVE
ncbi:MAG TPA: hypothetical protein VJL32_01285 [Candidatus Paceibacterota bacterium]